MRFSGHRQYETDYGERRSRSQDTTSPCCSVRRRPSGDVDLRSPCEWGRNRRHPRSVGFETPALAQFHCRQSGSPSVFHRKSNCLGPLDDLPSPKAASVGGALETVEIDRRLAGSTVTAVKSPRCDRNLAPRRRNSPCWNRNAVQVDACASIGTWPASSGAERHSQCEVVDWTSRFSERPQATRKPRSSRPTRYRSSRPRLRLPRTGVLRPRIPQASRCPPPAAWSPTATLP